MSEFRNPDLKGGAQYWRIIRELHASQRLFTINDVYMRSHRVGRCTVANYVAALLADGRVAIESERSWGGRFERTYRLTQDSVRPPTLSQLHNPRAVRRQQMWRAMRSLREFTIRELALAASTEDALVSESVAQNYVWWLRRAGYVSLLGRIGTVGRYRLSRRHDTGPLAPVVRHREQQIVDRNNGAAVNLNGVAPLGWAA